MSVETAALLKLWTGFHPDQWGAFTWGPPERVLPGVEGWCWGNARRAAAADPGLAYVEGVMQREGYACQLHGWCLDRLTGGVVEVTGPRYSDAVSYRGVALEPLDVEQFLDRGDRRGAWEFAAYLGEVHAEPPAVLHILLEELARGLRNSLETWAEWRELRSRAASARRRAAVPRPVVEQPLPLWL